MKFAKLAGLVLLIEVVLWTLALGQVVPKKSKSGITDEWIGYSEAKTFTTRKYRSLQSIIRINDVEGWAEVCKAVGGNDNSLKPLPQTPPKVDFSKEMIIWYCNHIGVTEHTAYSMSSIDYGPDVIKLKLSPNLNFSKKPVEFTWYYHVIRVKRSPLAIEFTKKGNLVAFIPPVGTKHDVKILKSWRGIPGGLPELYQRARIITKKEILSVLCERLSQHQLSKSPLPKKPPEIDFSKEALIWLKHSYPNKVTRIISANGRLRVITEFDLSAFGEKYPGTFYEVIKIPVPKVSTIDIFDYRNRRVNSLSYSGKDSGKDQIPILWSWHSRVRGVGGEPAFRNTAVIKDKKEWERLAPLCGIGKDINIDFSKYWIVGASLYATNCGTYPVITMVKKSKGKEIEVEVNPHISHDRGYSPAWRYHFVLIPAQKGEKGK